MKWLLNWPDKTNPFSFTTCLLTCQRILKERKKESKLNFMIAPLQLHYSSPQIKEWEPVQFVFTKWRLLVLQRSSYHGDRLQRGYLVCPVYYSNCWAVFFFYIPFHIISTEEPPGCRSVTASLLVLHFKLPPPWAETFWFMRYLFLSQPVITLDMQQILI